MFQPIRANLFTLLATLTLGATAGAADSDLRSFTYPEKDLSGRPATLKNGRFEGDHLTVQTVMTLKGDFKKDGRTIGAAVVVLNSGGSGNFRHLCLLTRKGAQTTCSDTVFLGDRIKVTGLNTRNGEILVEYLDRDLKESFTTKPHIKRTRRFGIRNGRLTRLPRPKIGD